MNYILFDGAFREQLLPFTFTRPIADIRIGILTLREKWSRLLGATTSSLTAPYLAAKFPLKLTEDNLLICASVIPTPALVEAIHDLEQDEALMYKERIIALRTTADKAVGFERLEWRHKSCNTALDELQHSWEIFSKNEACLKADFDLITKNRQSETVSDTNFVIGPVGDIFIEKGARVSFAYLNAEKGPIYIGRDAEVMEGAKIRGPFALCDHGVLKMDAKIYGATTIGPWSKVGGEVHNSVIFGYSNKGHDGYLGNAVIGEWCNLGADTNNSNLKNTYDMVKLWDYTEQGFVDTGLQFCGLMMGDHSKSGINTMFNTGTVVGVSCNLFGAGFQRNYIPSFSWGGPQGYKAFNMQKAIEVASAMYTRRGKDFDAVEKEILNHIGKLPSSMGR